MGKPKLEKHLKVFSKIPRIVYKFENEYLSTFQENFRLLGDLPFTIYFDLETTCGKKLYEDFTDPTKKCTLFHTVLLLHFTLYFI